MKKQLISSFLLLLTAIIWGFSFVAQAVSQVGTLTFTGLRFVLAAMVTLPICLIFSRGISKETIKETVRCGLIVGVVLFVASILQQFAIDLGPSDDSMKAGFITGLYSVFVPVAGFIFLKKKTGFTTWIGVVAAISGLFLLCNVGSASLHFTDILLFASVPIWTAHILLIDHLNGRGRIDPLVLSLTQTAVCGILSLICAIIFEPDSLFSASALATSWLPILYGGVMSGGIAFALQVVGQKHANPTVAAILLSTESMFSAIGNLLIIGVDMTTPQFIGCGIIFFGIIISQINVAELPKRKKLT